VIPYRVFGDKGPFLVCINGAGQSMVAWRPVISQVSRDIRVVTFDFPGQGRGEILSGGYVIEIDEQVGIVAEVIDVACGSESINIVSASWGGLIAASYASAFSDRVSKMILGSFSTKINQSLLDMLKSARERVAAGESGFGGELIIETFGRLIPDVYKRRILDQFRYMDENSRQALLAHASFFESIYTRGDEIDFSKIKAETLIINGENDTIIEPHDAHRIAESMPDCRVEIIAGVGHFLLFEREDLIGMYKDFFLADAEKA
jgi:pimeloyl-ACP methyl ester carboxylesterase